MYISYEYYRIFYHVARCGNLTKAAEALQNSQPNLTRAIRNLEAEIGCPLFSRTNRGMILTPEGEGLYRHIKIACTEIEAGEAAVPSKAGSRRDAESDARARKRVSGSKRGCASVFTPAGT